MRTIWNEASRRDIMARLSRLAPDAPARWGRMNAPQAVAHLADALRMALGELPCAPKHLPIRYPPLKQLIVYVLPFPKGVDTAPELIGRPPSSWGGEMTDILRLLERVAQRPPASGWPDHPSFGRLSRRAWGVLIYRHMDHHLSQFGV
jgi:hypothetical protein